MATGIYLFVSPHLDDGVLSCGGYIHQLTAQGARVVIATVVTADDTRRLPLSGLAQRSLRAWGLNERPYAVRCAEDISAARVLGAQAVHLGLLESFYRRDEKDRFLYPQRVRDVPVHPSDWEVFAPALKIKLAELLHQHAAHQVHLFCPLALGNHVDHILVRRVVESMTDSRSRSYYEDLPYALQLGAEADHQPGLMPAAVAISPQDLQARLDASACYVSQVPGLFPSPLEILHEIVGARIPLTRKFWPRRFNLPASIRRMSALMRAYSSRIGGERYWTVPGSNTPGDHN